MIEKIEILKENTSKEYKQFLEDVQVDIIKNCAVPSAIILPNDDIDVMKYYLNIKRDLESKKPKHYAFDAFE